MLRHLPQNAPETCPVRALIVQVDYFRLPRDSGTIAVVTRRATSAVCHLSNQLRYSRQSVSRLSGAVPVDAICELSSTTDAVGRISSPAPDIGPASSRFP